MTAWITWLRGFSIRSRLLSCMALVVVIGTAVGGGTSWQLLQLRGNLDNFADQEFAATQQVGELAQVLGRMRTQEQAAIINTGDSVTAEQHVKAWKAHLAAAQKALVKIGQATPTPRMAEQVKALGSHL